MILRAKEQIKSLLAQKNITIKRLAEMLTEYTGQKWRADSLSHKLRRGTITYNDVMLIAELLEYQVLFQDKR